MKKYIRTKDGRIYEIIEETENSFELCGPFEKKMGCNCIMIKRVLGSNEKPTYRLAGTIEELCDEAVFFDDKNKPHYQSQEGNIWYLGAGLYTKTLRFGIFTDKGLIYVAKMNEEEELELL